MKRQARDWEVIFTNHVFDQRLVSRTYKEPSKLKNSKTNNPIRKWATDMDRYLGEEGT